MIPGERPATLTEGPVSTHLWRMARPTVLALLALMGFNVADTWCVARLGPLPLAAMSFTFPVVLILAALVASAFSSEPAVLAGNILAAALALTLWQRSTLPRGDDSDMQQRPR